MTAPEEPARDMEWRAAMTEGEARSAYIEGLERGSYETAAKSALIYAEHVSVRSPEGALVLTTAATALATLALGQTQTWLWENRMPSTITPLP